MAGPGSPTEFVRYPDSHDPAAQHPHALHPYGHYSTGQFPYGHYPSGQVPNGQYSAGPYPTAAYPAPGYGGYPYAPGLGPDGARRRPRRPGVATAAGVLGIVYGSLLLVAAFAVFNLPLVLGEGNGFSQDPGRLTNLATELAVVSMVTAVCGGVMIVGGILIFRRDRSAVMTGAVLSLLISIYWLIRTGLAPQFRSWPLIFAIIPVIILVQCLGRTVAAWTRRRPV